ncbi:macrolide-efflux protein [Streptococcus pneumoniae]|nr:macrolide-efflux protein [Streptococcus pneumoniae]
MKEGVVVLRQNKGLFALLLLGTLYTFVYMPINALFPLISMEHFNGTPVNGDQFSRFGNTSSKWICNIRSLLCNNGAFGAIL